MLSLWVSATMDQHLLCCQPLAESAAYAKAPSEDTEVKQYLEENVHWFKKSMEEKKIYISKYILLKYFVSYFKIDSFPLLPLLSVSKHNVTGFITRWGAASRIPEGLTELRGCCCEYSLGSLGVLLAF